MTRRAPPLAVVLLLAMLAAACVDQGGEQAPTGDQAAPADWTPQFVDGELQPLPDGFPNRPITLVNVDIAGSRSGIYCRSLDRALEGISPVDVVVSDEPSAAGGTPGAVVDTKTRDGGLEGYYPVHGPILGVVSDFHGEPLEEELGIAYDDINYFIATETQPYMVSQRKGAPWGPSFRSLIDYAKQHPGELRYIAPGVGSGTDVAMAWMLSNLQLDVKKIPGASHDAAIAAVGAGEADFTITRVDLTLAADQAGRIDVLLATTEQVPEVWAGNANVLSGKDYASLGLPDNDWGITAGLLLPKEVPELHVRWLYALFEAAAKSATYRERATSVPGTQVEILTTEQANAYAREAYEFTEPVMRAEGLHHESQ